MYKLLLCLRYLLRRPLAYVAALAVMLCTAMVLLSVSVFDGFLRNVERAAKGLFGDVIVDSVSLSGIGRYDEFISRLTGDFYVEAPWAPADTPQGRAFSAPATAAQIEGLAGTLQFEGEPSWRARADVWRDGRVVGQAAGQLTLRPDRTLLFRPDVPPGEGELGVLYARVGPGLPEIEAATPVIYAYGLLRVRDVKDFCTPVQLAGIRLPERLRVTNFEKGLFLQQGMGDASFAPPLGLLLARFNEYVEQVRQIAAREDARPPGKRDAELIDRLRSATWQLAGFQTELERVVEARTVLAELRRALAAEQAKPPDQRDAKRVEELSAEIAQLDEALKQEFRPLPYRAILGDQIAGLGFRTSKGEAIRLMPPGREVVLWLLPLGRGTAAPRDLTGASRTFTVIDQSRTDIYTIDSSLVYVSFDVLQQLAEMDERRDEEQVWPAVASQIQIKVKPAFAGDRRLVEVGRKVDRAWKEFAAARPDAARSTVYANTWREKLAKYIGPIQSQRTLVILMFGSMSIVSVILIFAIFYMIVMQKMRDIGVIRAVGGSAPGVAQVFLLFGAVQGVLGAVLGVILGWLGVYYINPIHDWVGEIFGFVVWNREVFLFDKIPNEVDPGVVLVVIVWALFSGLVGALIPAVRAGMMQPVEALRYE